MPKKYGTPIVERALLSQLKLNEKYPLAQYGGTYVRDRLRETFAEKPTPLVLPVFSEEQNRRTEKMLAGRTPHEMIVDDICNADPIVPTSPPVFRTEVQATFSDPEEEDD